MKASLELYPEVQLIKSISDFDMSDDDILDKVTMFENVENQIPKSEDIDVQADELVLIPVLIGETQSGKKTSVCDEPQHGVSLTI